MTASNQLFSAFSFISFVLTSIPFAWHLEAWNTGTCIYMGWISLSSLFLFINSVVWNGNAVNWAPVYCDIVTKFFIGVTVSIPAAALCINRRLYHIIRVKAVTRTASEKRRSVLVDLLIGVGIPVLVMILHVVVQGHRCDIYEDIGCFPTIYNTHLAYVLVLTPPLALAVVACIYCVLNLISLKRNYLDFKRLLSSNGTNSVTANRYIRLMCLAGLEALLDIPINLYVIIVAAKSGVQPWISWEETHFDFNRFDQVPAILWRNDNQLAVNLERTRWTVVICGFIFFAFFGFADEAMKNYKLAYNLFARKFGWRLVHIPGTTPPGGYSAKASNGSSRGGTDNGGDQRKAGVLRGNGTESWMNSFDAFANKIKLVVLQSSGSVSLSGRSTTGTVADEGLPVFVTTEMVQKRDTDSVSMLTSLTEFSCQCAVPGYCEQEARMIQHMPSGSTYVASLSDKEGDESGSNYSESLYPQSDAEPESTTLPTSPPPPPVPPKDSLYTTSSLTVPNPAAFRVVSNRTPPKQTIPTSVSISPTPNGSFLDLSISELEVSPIRGGRSVDNCV